MIPVLSLHLSFRASAAVMSFRPSAAVMSSRPEGIARSGGICRTSSPFHRKRNGKPLMLTKTHSLPFPFLFSLFKRRLIPKAFLSPRAAVERSDSKGRSFGSGLRPTLRMTEATAQYDKKVLPEVRDDVVAGEGGKVGGKFRRIGFPGQGKIADDKTQ